ncbi:MAG: acetate--CoA ligase family protein [bacterium]
MNKKMNSINGIFYPNSVAIFGVSNKIENLGQYILKNMIDNKYQGKIYPIGREGGEINGTKIYRDIDEINEKIDLAVILTPAQTVPDILRKCGERGVNYAVIESGGFSETGEHGKKLEQELIKIADTYNIRFTGPNGLGVINMENGLCTPFSPVVPPIRKGNVSIISQSGGMSLTIMHTLSYEGVGINKVISAGNKANIDEIDYLLYLIEDPVTNIIAMYLEDIKDGTRLIELIQNTNKPVVIFKSNTHIKTAKIASSHASAIANDDAVVTEALREAGAIRAENLTEFVDIAKLLSISPNYGDRVAVLSRSGGHAVITQDALIQYGFDTPSFSDHFLKEIHKHVRAGVINFTNPLDMGDIYDFEFYINAVELTLSDTSFDFVIFIHTYSSALHGELSDEMAKSFMMLNKKYKKPVIPLFFTEISNLNRLKERVDYPFFTDPATMLKAVAKIKDVNKYKRKDKITPVTYAVKGISTKVKNTLSLLGSLNVAQFHGLPAVPWGYARSREELKNIIEELGYPVVMKIESRNVSHKSDIGGVILDINNEIEAYKAYDWLTDGIKKAHPEIIVDGVIVQKMLKGPLELIVAAKRDEQFGPIVIVGMGGIYTEFLKDTALGLCPVTEAYALEMLKRLKGYPLLAGVRGQKPLAVQEVVNLIVAVSQIMVERFNIVELDLNPVLVDQEKAIALDARVVVEKIVPAETVS